MRLAKWVFYIAGVYGLLSVAPGYFLEGWFGRAHPPAVTHPEFYYGFIGVVLAWQVLFLLIGSDPVRYRPAMIPAILEKLGFVIAAPILVHQGRTPQIILAGAAGDAILLVLFVLAYLRTPRSVGQRGASDQLPH